MIATPTSGSRIAFFAVLGLVCARLLGPGASPCQAADEAIPDSDCLQCHSDRELARTNTDGRTISLYVDEEAIRKSQHGTNSCASCHRDIGTGHPDDGVAVRPVDCGHCHPRQSESYGASAHSVTAREGRVAACVDCHGGHQVIPRSAPDSPLHADKILDTCGACHSAIAQEVRESVHGKALLAGRRDAPTCTDCHAEHQIEDLRKESPIRAAQKTCSRCHASERINAKYRMPGDRVRTFLGSYHGLAAQLGSTRAANCASCHGFHRILPSSDPASTIHPNHLVETCGKCHPGATENFALSKVHIDENGSDVDLGATVNRWVRRLYQLLIVVTIGVFAFHNGLIWWRKAAADREASRASGPNRMDRHQRTQHLILAISFIVLAWSGFALKYPDSWVAWLLGSDETIRRWSHRAAALALMGLGSYHVFYVAFSAPGRGLVRDLFPSAQDWRELRLAVRRMLGRGVPGHPQARFGYVEKIEYWAVVWGTIIMGATGLVIWFPVEFTRFFPRWAVDVAVTIHYYEAILACLAILVWHFYHVIFDPDVYPMNWAFWHGHAPAAHGTPAETPEKTIAPPTGRS